MDLGSFVLSVVLFYLFVPGVIGHFPEKAGKGMVILVHAILFAFVASAVMGFYWTNLRHYMENMSNWGDRCPNGYIERMGKTGTVECLPSGHRTY
jgi:hypothetical protein